MTDEEKALLIEYLIDAGEIFADLDIDVEDQFLEWYEVRQGVVSGETHYKAILDAARVRKRSLERALEGAQPPMSDLQGVCDHGTPCGCYAEGHAAGLAGGYAKRRNDPLEDLAWVPGSWTTSTSRRGGIMAAPRLGRSGLVMPIRQQGGT